jgi:hypothetical protein
MIYEEIPQIEQVSCFFFVRGLRRAKIHKFSIYKAGFGCRIGDRFASTYASHRTLRSRV